MNMAGMHNGPVKGQHPVNKGNKPSSAHEIPGPSGGNINSHTPSNVGMSLVGPEVKPESNAANVGSSNIGNNNLGNSNVGSTSSNGGNPNHNNGQHLQKGFNTMILPGPGQVQGQGQFQQHIQGQIQQQQPHVMTQQFNGMPNGVPVVMGNGGAVVPQHIPTNGVGGAMAMQQGPNKMGQFSNPSPMPGSGTSVPSHPPPMDQSFGHQQQVMPQNTPQMAPDTPGVPRSQASFSGRPASEMNKQQGQAAGGKKSPFARPPGQSPVNKPMAGPNLSKEQQEQMQNEINAKIFKRNLGNAGVIRVLDLIDQISNESIENLSNIEYWQRVVQVFFLSHSTLRITTPPKDSMAPFGDDVGDKDGEKSMLGENATVSGNQYELTAVTAPRFFVTSVLAGNVKQFLVNLPSLKFQVLNTGSIFIVSRISIQYYYKDGSLANVLGNLRLLMNREFRIESIDVKCSDYRPTIDLAGLDAHWQKFFESTKTVEPNGETKKNFFNHIHTNSEAMKNALRGGMSHASARILQISDVMSQLRSLMGFSMVNNVTSPLKALDMFMAANNNPQAATAHRPSFASGMSVNSDTQNPSLQKRVSDVSPLSTFTEAPKHPKRRKRSSVGSHAGSPANTDRPQ